MCDCSNAKPSTLEGLNDVGSLRIEQKKARLSETTNFKPQGKMRHHLTDFIPDVFFCFGRNFCSRIEICGFPVASFFLALVVDLGINEI